MRVMFAFELLDLMQDLGTVEESDVPSLGRGQAANGPAQVHEVGLDRVRHRVHSDLARQAVRLPRVTRAARGYDVAPVVRSTPGQWDQVVAGQ